MLIPVPLIFHAIIYASSRAIGKYGVCIILYCAYSWTLSVVMSTVVLSLKQDEYIDEPWMLLFLPLWMGFLSMFAFTIFMFPGLTKPKIDMHRTAYLLIAYNLGLLAFTILLLAKISEMAINSYIMFVPIYI
jgi:hypothetical protein